MEDAAARESANLWVCRFAVDHRLSQREEEILALLAAGVHPKAVSDRLDCGYATVRTHLRRMYKKVGCSGNRELLARLFSDACRRARNDQGDG